MTAPAITLALIPDGLSAVYAAPLMCAGVITFNSLRHSGARPGDLVEYLASAARPFGNSVRSEDGFQDRCDRAGLDKEPLARRLGAGSYINSKTQQTAAELLKLGGAKTVLATVTNGDAVSAVLGGLGVNGKLIILGDGC